MDDRYWKVKELIHSVEESSMPQLQCIVLQMKLVEMRRILLRYPLFGIPKPEHAPFYEFFNLAMQLSKGGFNHSLYDDVMRSVDRVLANIYDETETEERS